MPNEKQIIHKVIDLIKPAFEDDVTIIAAHEFDDERDSNMVLVGIDNTNQVNPGLEDYQYELSIAVDTLIADDRGGVKFNEIYTTVEKQLVDYIVHRKPLSDAFGDVPVVGFLYRNCYFTVTNESNRAIFNYYVYTSSPMTL